MEQEAIFICAGERLSEIHEFELLEFHLLHVAFVPTLGSGGRIFASFRGLALHIVGRSIFVGMSHLMYINVIAVGIRSLAITSYLCRHLHFSLTPFP